MDAVRILIINATLQLFVSSILGFILLIPMQPWGKNAGRIFKNIHDIRSTHIDWLVLGLMQFGIAFGMSYLPVPKQDWIAALLVYGGWMNPFPYLIRGLFGINAFSLSGPPKQILAALVALSSVTALTIAFFLLITGWLS